MVSVMLGPEDTFTTTPDEGANKVLTALGANPDSDFCSFNIQQTVSGTAGTPAPPPSAPPVG